MTDERESSNQLDGGDSPCAQRKKLLSDNIFSYERPFFSMSERVWNPPSDVYETEQNEVVIKMEIAGLILSDLQITAENNYLVVRGCRAEEPAKSHFHLMEIRHGIFERAFRLSFPLHPENINAQYHDGFLVITLERMPETPTENL
jgi:HSP20 family protein